MFADFLKLVRVLSKNAISFIRVSFSSEDLVEEIN